MTLWDGEGEMRAFRNSGPHAVAMRKLLDWCDEASFTHPFQGVLPVEGARGREDRVVRRAPRGIYSQTGQCGGASQVDE